ncbi:zf-CCHC domain-containing protein/UBN2 domain-containing protein [Cephalotus follicularis]|uniref:Zf-CCHC domain-containing protein/UBN2 domain-containing protein n=1 Tax=Cephalotus follicularis TaxID=3775 RepID=A0A1Q3CB21_CEPFO|nr:zf-CCHC domain-containing protein/UBN2 domain-containing protein [Cephalotus follicularis]
MFSRFTAIINSLKNLGKTYPNQELVRKILRYLPKSWTPKVTAIEEAKDLTTLPLEQLLGSLMTHETTLKNHKNEETKKMKPVSLRTSKEENESDEDGHMALITKQFKKFLKSQQGKKTFKKFPQNEESSKKEELICYECKKPGHFKSECPSLKKKEQFKKNNEHSKKKKAMIATWSDSDYSSSDEESDGKVANIAFMAMEEEEDDELHFSFDELQNAYANLFCEYENICLMNKTLNKNINSFSKEIESLKNENINYKNEIQMLNVSLNLSNDFKDENENLKLEIDSLKKKLFSNFQKVVIN